MLLKISIFGFMILINYANAQFVQPSRLNYYDEVYTSSFITYGIGNIGFDTKLNSYNPSYFNSKSIFKATVISNLGLTSAREYLHKNISDGTIKYSEGNLKIAPSLEVQYKFDEFVLSLDFTNDVFFTRNLESKQFGFSTSTGTYSVGYDKPELSISNNILQLSVAKKMFECFSVSLSILTNRYNYSLHNNSTIQSNINDLEISSNLFSNLQFLFSINYNYKNKNSAYILFKTQNTEVEMTPTDIKINNSIIIGNWSKINFPALLGYGAQIGELDKLKLSIEFFHKMIFKENNGLVHNTTINLGVNYNTIDPLYFGFMFSYPIKLKQSVKMNPAGDTWDYNYFLAEPRNRFNIAVTSTYTFQSIDVFLGYQYSKIASDNGIEVFKDYASRLQIGISYNL